MTAAAPSGGSPISASTEAKPKPCSSPKAKAMRQRASVISGNTLFTAATMIEAAITDSVSRPGSRMMSSAASDSVSECASVNAVTTLRMLSDAGAACGRACQRPAPQQHRGQQQRKQEQQVIDAAPDVPDAGLQIFDECGAERRMSQIKALYRCRRAAAQHGGLCHPLSAQGQQSTMRRILGNEQMVVDGQAREGAGGSSP